MKRSFIKAASAAVVVLAMASVVAPAEAVTSKTISDPSGDPVLKHMTSAPSFAKPDADILKVTYSKDATRFHVRIDVRNLTRPQCGWVAWEKVTFAGGDRVLWAGVDGCDNSMSLQYIKNGAYVRNVTGGYSYANDFIRVSIPKTEVGAGSQTFAVSALTMQNNSCGCGYQDWSTKTTYQVR